MSAKINLYSGLLVGSAAAVEPKPGFVYVVTKITFKNEGDLAGNVAAGRIGLADLVSSVLPAHRETGWEGTEVVEFGETITVSAAPAGAVRCIVEGYFLIDVPAFARYGAGAMDAAFAAAGALPTEDSKLAALTYLTLVELKQIRMTLAAQTGNGADRAVAVEEIDRELES